jgi:hypothetical protein
VGVGAVVSGGMGVGSGVGEIICFAAVTHPDDNVKAIRHTPTIKISRKRIII